MSTLARLPATMVLPVAEASSGEVSGTSRLVDTRIPIPFRYDRRPYVLAFLARSERCPTGRHLRDVITATAPEDVQDEDSECAPHGVRFRMSLTCVRCGRIERVEGFRENETARAWSAVGEIEV